MIKILKPGRDLKNYAITYKKTCQRCGCEFEFEESDCDSVEYEKRLGGAIYAEITCPHCHSKLLYDYLAGKKKQENFCDLGAYGKRFFL